MINAIEKNTKVKTPTGHEGRVIVTRRERILISKGEQKSVKILCRDGLYRTCPIDQLTIITKDKECYECGKFVNWLAPDSRCGDCTRFTPDEIRGE